MAALLELSKVALAYGGIQAVKGIDLEVGPGELVCLIGANADAVAELAIAGMLALLRNLPNLDRTTRAGGWDRFVGHTLRGRTVGLVGFGAVATWVFMTRISVRKG